MGAGAIPREHRVDPSAFRPRGPWLRLVPAGPAGLSPTRTRPQTSKGMGAHDRSCAEPQAVAAGGVTTLSLDM